MLSCAFCQSPITRRPATLAGRVESCERCGARFTIAESEEVARTLIAGALEIEPLQVEAVSSPASDGQLLVCGWDPEETLTPEQVAAAVRKSKQTVQQHLREGRFDGAYQAETADGEARFWRVPRSAVLFYQRLGRKPYTVRPGVERGRPPRKKRPTRKTAKQG